MKLLIYKQSPVRLPITKIRRLFALIVHTEAESGWTSIVNLVLTTDPAIRKLNHRFRAINRPTDVLAFPMENPRRSGEVFGEVYISVTTARRQAVQYGTGFNRECLRLFCHGLLHLFGYDHQRASEEKRMQHKEQYFLAQIGEKT